MDIPEIVAPSPELPPSAMKGASGNPPRSPKDKVTFDLNLRPPSALDLEAGGSTKDLAVLRRDSLGAELNPSPSINPSVTEDRLSPDPLLPTLAVMEPTCESDLDCDLVQESAVMDHKLEPDLTVSSVVSMVGPPSPGCERDRLLPHAEEKRGARKKIY